MVPEVPFHPCVLLFSDIEPIGDSKHLRGVFSVIMDNVYLFFLLSGGTVSTSKVYFQSSWILYDTVVLFFLLSGGTVSTSAVYCQSS
jgi:hypothetical protein